MAQDLRNFLEKISCDFLFPLLQTCTIESAEYRQDRKQFALTLSCSSPLPPEDAATVKKTLLATPSQTEIRFSFERFEETHIYSYSNYFFAHVSKIMSEEFTEHLRFKLKNDTITVECVTNSDLDDLAGSEEKLSEFLLANGFPRLIIETKLCDRSSMTLQALSADGEKTQQLAGAVRSDATPSFQSPTRPRKNAIPKGEVTRISDLVQGQSTVIVGEVFKVSSTPTKSGGSIVRMFLTDGTDSIVAKTFLPSRISELNTSVPGIKSGMKVKATVDMQVDEFDRNNLVAMLKAIQPVDGTTFKKVDSGDLRIEFAVHTKMTSYDGVSSIAQYVKTAKAQGIKALAITDRSNVQSFPEIQRQRDQDVRVIYGTELNFIKPAVKNHDQDEPVTFLDRTYVIYDLETTGLFANVNEIIEFGAVKIKNGRIVDRFQTYIRPKKSIPHIITEITRISDKTVADAPNFSAIYEQIRDWVGDAVMVAHNGLNFDSRFLRAECERHGVAPFLNPLIDTMLVSRAINEFAYHNLGFISRRYRIDYNEDVAHRADYDAEVLAQIWLTMIDQLQQMNIANLSQLETFMASSSRLKSKEFGHWLLVYPKNQAGIRDLYRIISLMHTETLYGSPKIMLESLAAVRSNLIIANSPTDGDVWDAALSGDPEALKRSIAFYDFITVPPPDVLCHEVARNTLEVKQIQDAIARIIAEARALGKKVTAVSDAYYAHPSHQIYRDVYIYTKGLGGKYHRLYQREDKNPCFPKSHLRSTADLREQFAFLDQATADAIILHDPETVLQQIDAKMTAMPSGLHAPKIEGVEEKLRDQVKLRLAEVYGTHPVQEIAERAQKELSAIIDNGFSVVYWICYLLVKKSLDDGYLVGSRGSVGSSLIAYLLGITEVNPLPAHYRCPSCQHTRFVREADSGFDLALSETCPMCASIMIGDGHDIPFETFLGFEGNKVPDIDLNFSGEYQARAHAFIRDMFGESHTFRAGTISTIAEKTAYGYVKNYFELTGRENVRDAEVERLAAEVQGVKRTTGQHPGGVIIVPKDREVFDFFPYNFPADDKESEWKTTHFEFEAIHDNLLKLDILGHDDPTALKMLHEITGIDPKHIPTNDAKVMSIFTGVDALGLQPAQILDETVGTAGVPEFGTDFVRRMLKETRPRTFADLIRVSGLSHGTDVWSGNSRNLIMSGGLKLSDLIACRDDIMVYLSRKNLEPITAFLIMEDVRKGKGVKPEWIQLMKAHEVPDWYIECCKKIKYMFPKAHATAYVLMAWRIAWYKVYRPCEYYATYFSTRPDVFDIETITSGPAAIRNKHNEVSARLASPLTKKAVKEKEKSLLVVYEIALECWERGITIALIDLERSEATRYVADAKNMTVIPPFTAIDGLGEAAARSVVEARQERPLVSLSDVIERTALSKTHIAIMTKLGVLAKLDKVSEISLF